MLFLLFVFLALFFGGAFAFLRAKRLSTWELDAILVALTLIASTFAGLQCVTVVDAGHRGVVVLFGRVTGDVLPEGAQLVNPFANVVEMSSRVVVSENKYSAETSDTQTVELKVQMNWRPDGDRLAGIYRAYGEKYAPVVIDPALNEIVRAEVSRYTIAELVRRRTELSAAIRSAAEKWIARHSLVMLELSVGEFDFSAEYDKAIEAKQAEEQRALSKEYEVRGAEAEAKKIVAKARGDADAVKAAATAEAEALRIRAEAQADYNRRIAESLTPILVERMKAEKWDGKLPVYLLGSATPMIELPAYK